jgi:hypothetical protein
MSRQSGAATNSCGQVLLVDEVGLGKTIEAGLLLREETAADILDQGIHLSSIFSRPRHAIPNGERQFRILTALRAP